MKEERDPRIHELDRALRGVRFEPRASLGAEIAGRWRRGEGQGPSRTGRPRRILGLSAVLAAIGVSGGLALRFFSQAPRVVIDHCCEDFDLGGEPDDGLLVVAGPHEQVERLAIYEDRDGSRSFTGPDAIRFDRRSHPVVQWRHLADVHTAEYCCLDYDGGGEADDALVVVARPPDQIALAVIYEQDPSAAAAALLR